MKTSNLFKAFSAVVAAIFILANTAFAQTTILVVNQERVKRESEVGKHINRQLESIAKQMDAELKSQVNPIVSERDTLMGELQNMSVDALKTRPDLVQRAQSTQEKMKKAELEARYKQLELQKTEQTAQQQVNTKLGEILEALVKERNADVILDRSLVIYSGPNTDVTDVVISRLNAQMRTVPVTRVRVPRQQAPQQ